MHEPGFDTKRTLEHEAKLAIARRAAALVEPGMAVAVSAGSTTYEVSRRLTEIPRLTVVTNSVPAAEVLYHGGRSDQTIMVRQWIIQPGTINEDTTWSGLLKVLGPVTVASGVTLTIEPGSIVKFADSTGRLNVQGSLDLFFPNSLSVW